MRMRKLTVYVPEEVKKELLRLLEEKKIRSISEFVRNILVHYIEYGGITIREVREYREVRVWGPRREKSPEEKGWAGYGEHHKEVVKQLLEVFQKKKEKKS